MRQSAITILAAALSRMSSSRKKVIIRRLAGDTIPGYLPPSGFVRGIASEGIVELLDLSGRIKELPLSTIKTISFVRDFNLSDLVNPERLTRRAFLARPRTEGIWIRLTFRSESPSDRSPEILEGLASPDLAFLDSLIEDAGIHLTPPDTRSNTQVIFVPRSAIASLNILAVITTPSRIKPAPPRSAEEVRRELQDSLFDIPTPPNTRPN